MPSIPSHNATVSARTIADGSHPDLTMGNDPHHKVRAFLDVPVDRSAAGLRMLGARSGAEIIENPKGLTLCLASGSIGLSADGSRTALTISARNMAAIQILRDMVAMRVQEFGLTLEWETRSEPHPPANLAFATVTEVRRLTPSYTRVTLDGPDLARFTEGGLHFRLLFGPDGAGWPMTDEGGVTQWPGGIRAWHRPVYTTRAITTRNDGSARIDFDVFLHEGGRVTEWARHLVAGEKIAIAGPSGGRGPSDAGWVGLVGDETAVPVMARVLARLHRDTCGKALLFVPKTADIQKLIHPSGMDINWIIRGSATPLDALRSLAIPASDRQVFFAAERGEALAARSFLADAGLGRSEFIASSYWAAGS